MPHDARPHATVRPKVWEVAATTLMSELVHRAAVSRGFGVDIVDIPSFAHNCRLGGDRWLRKVFTDLELGDCAGDVGKLAARFAAKEAVAKALGSGFRGVGPRDIETLTAHGQPMAQLYAGAAAAAAARDVGSVLISMTREAEVAMAAAIALPCDDLDERRRS